MKFIHNGLRWVDLIRTALLFVFTLVGVPGFSQLQPLQDWESALYTDEPLVGKIWHSASEQFVDVQDLANAIDSARYLLLGEKHDNPDHHSLQLKVLNHLIEQARVAAVAFEMMDSDDQEALDQIPRQDLTNLENLKEHLKWDEDGWGWGFYGPLVLAVVLGDIPVAGANITDATMSEVYGEDAVPEAIAILDEETMQQLNLDIDESHCGLLPESQFPAMVRVQQARDYNMANSMASPEAGKLSVLVAGNYHVRRDLGVPNYLLAREKTLKNEDILTLSFMEVEPGEADPVVYLQQFKSQLAFDYVWFTPAISDADYCASLR